MQLLAAAVESQTDIMVSNILGDGMDLHLLALRELSKELEGDLPEIFKDENYAFSNQFRLSTSQVRAW